MHLTWCFCLLVESERYSLAQWATDVALPAVLARPALAVTLAKLLGLIFTVGLLLHWCRPRQRRGPASTRTVLLSDGARVTVRDGSHRR